MPVRRVIFMGSPSFAVPSLRAVAEHFEVAAVYTQPPRPAGRGQALQKTAVHEAAEAMGLKVRHPERLKEAALAEILATEGDAVAVVGYGLLLPKALVESRVCVNVHPSALPRWRGASPVQSALLAGDTTTAVCIMRLEAGMDTGPVYDRTAVEIPPDMTAGELNGIVWEIGARRLVEVLRNLAALTPLPQAAEGATHAPKITPEVRRIDWRRSATEVHNKIRALSPAPGAVAALQGEEMKILRSEVAAGAGAAGGIIAAEGQNLVVACGQGAVRLLLLQRPGRKAMAAGDFLRGMRLVAGQRWG
jgi:methionyl-tRNA formyltransferase